MADSEEQLVSSTTPSFGEELISLADPDTGLGEPDRPKLDPFNVDDIVDLVGGAQDAIERHLAEDSAPSEVTEASFTPPQEPETVLEPEPEAAPAAGDVEEEEEEEEDAPASWLTKGEAIPDSTTSTLVRPDTPPHAAEPPVAFAPKAEPESTKLAPEPEVVHQPEPGALPPAEPRTAAAAAPAEAAEEAPAPASYAPSPPKAQPQPLMQFPTEHWESPFLASQDSSKVSMDTVSKDTAPVSSSRYEPDLHGNQSDEDDDLMFEVKKNNNPFEGYSPLADAGYSHFGDAKSDSRATKMSESPTPDLVQYGQTGDSQDSPPSFYNEGKMFEAAKIGADSLMQSANQFSSNLKDDDDEEEEEEDSALPPSLPDILKSSPLNPDKIDSGSSEGSPEEQSPVLERRMMESPNPPINLSANNPFAFDSKVSLLKEMAEETEARAAEKVKVEDDKGFGAFDLVKEAAETTPAKVKEEEPVKIEQKDWFASHDSPKMTGKFEPLDFQSKKTPADDSDSESPTADSLSPVLEAMAKNPASFQVEMEKRDLKMEVEEAEVAEEVSEPEVSSEEFEFIERPPRGVIDEFLEALDNSKFASPKAPEIPMDDDVCFGKKDEAPVSAPAPTKVVPPPEIEEEEAPSQSSYLLLTQASSKSSPQKGKAELEKPEADQPPSQATLVHSPVSKPEEAVAKKSTEGGKMLPLPNLSSEAVVELLYWRDLKTTGVVFGATLLLLLSLTICSIVSVSSYVGLALLSVTISFRIYKGILQAIQKSDEGHPFKQYLDQEVALSEDMVHKYSDMILTKLNKSIGELRRLFLVEDLVDSIKFAVLMWILTYVGALFNGLTLLILGLVGAFSCPIIYEKHQVQIDHYLALVNNQIKDVIGKIQAKVPGLKRKAE
ncbi:reticulon-4b isoform X2 [Myripristis murdjan]|uniref:reticulon-4b isoform X2 n=1 Tax=Myripristis murdjan TaxID=586833 RepID=UPI001175E39F|nr:reticulon-4-like isoform X2 [Myripristis murdjan]